MKVVSYILIAVLIGGLGFLCVWQAIGLVKDIKRRRKNKKNIDKKED